MRKSKKGVTLIEVIVSIAIFSMISLALFSSVISMKKVIIRQEEYVRIEMVCYDISAYYEKYKASWPKEYFNSKNNNIGYLTSDFIPTTDENIATYKIIFSENEIKCILSMDGETIYVENIDLPIASKGAK